MDEDEDEIVDDITRQQLDRWCALAERMRAFTQAAEHHLQFPGTERVIRLLLALVEQANLAILVEMQEVGAVRPYMSLAAPDIPEHLQDTPATKRLARVLREAREAARDVDTERGWIEAGLADAVDDFARTTVKVNIG